MKKAKSLKKTFSTSISRKVQKKNVKTKFNGRIVAKSLNVRDEASVDSNVIGKLKKDQIVEVILDKGGWCQIKFEDSTAYISSKYVKKVIKKGTIIANKLNVRNAPDGEVIGKLKKSDKVVVLAKEKTWYKIIFGGKEAYVASKYVRMTAKSIARSFLYKDADLQKIELVATNKMPVTGGRIDKIVAEMYNKYGNFLEALSDEIGIDIATAIAVMSVESGGKGFIDGKLIIRFENHLFYRYWGVNNPDKFADHFSFRSNKKWLDHKFRASKDDAWESFHGKQTKEWEVFEFARKLDNNLAIKSISMGAPQILGSNAKTIGYDSMQKMFDNFEENIRYHIFAFFDFLSPRMIKYLQNSEFVNFAKYYNGTGQAQRYGKIIQDYFEIFKKNS